MCGMAPSWSLSRKRKINPTAMGVMNIGASSIDRVRSRAQRCFCSASAMARPITNSSPTATHDVQRGGAERMPERRRRRSVAT